MLNAFFNIRSSFTTIQILFEVQKRPWRCCTVKVTAWTVVWRTMQAIRIISPAGHRAMTHNLITQQVAHARPAGNHHPKERRVTGVSIPPTQPSPAPSVQQSTAWKDHDRRVTIVSRYTGNKRWAKIRYAGYFDVATGREALRWLGRTDPYLDGCTIANRFWVPSN